MKGRKPLSHVRQTQNNVVANDFATAHVIHETNQSHVRPSQILSQAIAKFTTYLSMSQIRVYNHIKRLYCYKKLIAVHISISK